MNHKAAIRTSLTFLSIALLLTIPAQSAIVVQESVKTAVGKASPSSYIELLLSFENDLDLTALKIGRCRDKLNRAGNYREVMNRLSRNRENLENDLIPELERMKASGGVESYRFFTVSKTVLIRARADYVDSLLPLPGLRLINSNSAVSLIAPVDENDVNAFAKKSLANSALETINVRSLWDIGLNGAGTLICSFDTGVDGDHPALGPKWRGNNGAASEAAWFAPHGDDVPDDGAGHGSHVMGIMVGGTDEDTIGVAFGAQWISAAVIDQGADFNTTIADILDAFDWALNPDGDITTTDDVPDVICNSWGVPKGVFDDCDNTFWTAIDNVEAAGIVTIFAAGNEGPTERSIRNPADRASSPINALSVGAIDASTLVVADFSSRGPANCDNSIKPELVAPGVGIYSTYKDGGYKIMSGTSMAAPFVAGLAALVRQYNPEATVEEIKYALLAATTDLGPAGEDNSYGHGLIDAARLIDYISDPTIPPLQVYNHYISSGGDSYADPGEEGDLSLTLNDPSGMTDSIDVWLGAASDQISIYPDTIRFYFAGGSNYAISLTPFRFHVSPEAISGQPVDINVHMVPPNGISVNTVTYTIVIGHELPGQIYPAGSNNISFSASDFGQFGFGLSSIYQAGGAGFRFGQSDNLLYEAGLIIGRSGQQVSDAVRNSDGGFKESDFIPDLEKKTTTGEEALYLSFSDDNAIVPIPVEVNQSIYRTGQDFVIIEFNVINPTPSRIERLSVGLFCDIDIDRYNDQIGFDTMMGMIYQYNAGNGYYIGMVGLSTNEFAYLAAANDDSGKTGFTGLQKYDMIDQSGIEINGDGPADWYFVVSHTAALIDGFACEKVAVAMVAGVSVEDLRAQARAAMDEYDLLLDAEEESLAMPSMIEMDQNYPNPFNPTTTISFNLKASKHASLVIYNIAGQKVCALVDGVIQAGRHMVIWDGRDASGATVSSGIYFYRLTSSGETVSRKMIFLK